MGERKHLPESELDIMLVIWREGGGVTAPAILEGLRRPLTASALHSYLKRLEEKGFLSRTKTGKVNTYTALVSEKEYRGQEGPTLLDKLYGSSLKTFAAALWDGGHLSREDVTELRAYLDELERGKG